MTVLVLGTLLVAWILQTGFVLAETRVIPSVVAAQRYDSNIFFSPRSFLPPGTKRDDFVTTAGADVKVLHQSRELEASITAGGDVNGYAHNSPLNFVTTRVNGEAILDGWVGQWAKGAQLRVYGRFQYTPETPGFVTGTSVGGGGAGDPFLRGIQGLRANTYRGIVSTEGSYPVAVGLNLEGRYSFSAIHVGSILASNAGAGVFFDTNMHTYSVGPRFAVTPVDSIFFSFRQSLISQTQSGGSSSTINTNAQSLLAGYARVMPDWRFSLEGGVALIEPTSKAFTTASMTITTNPEHSTIVRLDLSRQAAPSFFVQSGALISNVGLVQITHLLSERLTLRGSVSYGFNETVPSSTGVQFTNFTVSPGIDYKLTRTMTVGLFYDYTDFTTETPALEYTIVRNMVGLSLTGYWN